VGLNDIGRTSSTELIATVFTWDNLPVQFGTWDNMSLQTPTWDALINSVFKPKRIKFLKRSQNSSIPHLSEICCGYKPSFGAVPDRLQVPATWKDLNGTGR
jgi:hypothetical protein